MTTTHLAMPEEQLAELERAAAALDEARKPLLAIAALWNLGVCEIAGKVYVSEGFEAYHGQQRQRGRKMLAREWLAIPFDGTDRERRLNDHYRRTCEPWHRHWNPSPNIDADGNPCADDR